MLRGISRAERTGSLCGGGVNHRKLCARPEQIVSLCGGETTMKRQIKRVIIYAVGMIILAFGLVLNTKTGLGVSPLVSVAYTVSAITGGDFADLTFLLYGAFVVLELVLHAIRRKPAAIFLQDLLQLPVALAFSRLMRVFDRQLPALATDCAGTYMSALWFRLLMLLIAILLIGTGACLSIRMKLLPNPGDGAVAALADFAGCALGTAKNAFDITNVLIAVTIGLLPARHLIGIGIGTILAMLGVGRVIAAVSDILDRLSADGEPRSNTANGELP